MTGPEREEISLVALIDEKEKPLRMLLRENDFDDLEFRLAPSMLEGSGRWERKPRRFAFGEGLAPDPVIERMRAAWRDGEDAKLCDAVMQLERELAKGLGATLVIEETIPEGAPRCRFSLRV